MVEYFKCDKELTGCNVECCTSDKTIPEVGLGDLYRLSKRDDISIVSYWKQKGNFVVNVRCMEIYLLFFIVFFVMMWQRNWVC